MTKVSYVHFKFLPMSMRVLFTSVLLVFGAAYCMAMVQVWITKVGLDGKNYLTAKDLVIAYSGNPEGSKMQTALQGPMADMLDADNKKIVYTWLHEGAPKEKYDSTINPILQDHCVACHNAAANPNLPDYTSWEGVQKVTTVDTGMSIATLIRVSHIHLFGLTFIFFITGFIYAHSYVRPAWFKCVVLATPFLGLILDIAAWYLTKVWHGFAWAVIVGGALYGICFTIMWFTSMYQLWFFKPPQEVLDSQGQLPSLHRA
ncbi:MAG: elongation factor-1 alpha [Gallionellaceae bacterium]|nr:elongation factor-1 alpha [Gallionellaceae bacterium]